MDKKINQAEGTKRPESVKDRAFRISEASIELASLPGRDDVTLEYLQSAAVRLGDELLSVSKEQQVNDNEITGPELQEAGKALRNVAKNVRDLETMKWELKRISESLDNRKFKDIE